MDPCREPYLSGSRSEYHSFGIKQSANSPRKGLPRGYMYELSKLQQRGDDFASDWIAVIDSK